MGRGGTKVAQQRHLVLHSDGCMCLPGELSAAAGRASVPLPSWSKPLVPLVSPGVPLEELYPQDKESKQGFGSSRRGGGVKRLQREVLFIALSFFLFSFSMASLQSTGTP